MGNIRPIATSKFVPYRRATPRQGFQPDEVARRYGFANLDATDKRIVIIELGGGYTAADNKADFKAIGAARAYYRRSLRQGLAESGWPA